MMCGKVYQATQNDVTNEFDQKTLNKTNDNEKTFMIRFSRNCDRKNVNRIVGYVFDNKIKV